MDNKKKIKSYTIYGPEKWETYFVNRINKYLTAQGFKVSIKEKMKFNLDITDSIDNWYGVVRKNIIIQNNRTEQFFTIDHADQCNEISEDLASHPLCISILKCQYRKGFYGKWEHMVSAFTYGVKEWNKYFNLREYLIKVPKEKNQMYFKGNENGRKHILVNLLEKGLINKDYGLRTHNGGGRLKATQEEYLKNMAKRKIALSLPGIGNFCHRELEAFGIGVPVLMPILKNQYYNALIPDIHYIAINNSVIGDHLITEDHKIKRYTKQEEELLCKMIREKYENVINNEDYLKHISNSATSWFEKNINFPNDMILMKDILLQKFNWEFL